jgi:hypothetical protein
MTRGVCERIERIASSSLLSLAHDGRLTNPREIEMPEGSARRHRVVTCHARTPAAPGTDDTAGVLNRCAVR